MLMSKNSTVFSKINQANNEQSNGKQSMDRLLDIVYQEIDKSKGNNVIDSRLDKIIDKLDQSFD